MGERGVAVDHATLNRWVIKYAPEIEKQFRRRQSPVGRSWRMDETYVKIKGEMGLPLSCRRAIRSLEMAKSQG